MLADFLRPFDCLIPINGCFFGVLERWGLSRR